MKRNANKQKKEMPLNTEKHFHNLNQNLKLHAGGKSSSHASSIPTTHATACASGCG